MNTFVNISYTILQTVHKLLLLYICESNLLFFFFLLLVRSSLFYSLLNISTKRKQTHNNADTFLVHMDTIGTVSVYTSISS